MNLADANHRALPVHVHTLMRRELRARGCDRHAHTRSSVACTRDNRFWRSVANIDQQLVQVRFGHCGTLEHHPKNHTVGRGGTLEEFLNARAEHGKNWLEVVRVVAYFCGEIGKHFDQPGIRYFHDCSFRVSSKNCWITSLLGNSSKYLEMNKSLSKPARAYSTSAWSFSLHNKRPTGGLSPSTIM